MFWTFTAIGVLLFMIAFAMGREVFFANRCLSDADLRNYQYRKLEIGSRRYQHVITHLNACAHCRDRLRNLQVGPSIEDHLLDGDES